MNGGYDLEGVIYHQHSNLLMKKILELWPDKTIPIIDLGCGHNFYVTVLNYAGYDCVHGVDDVDLELGWPLFSTADITQKMSMNWCSDYIDKTGVEKINVISLEVGEHIPFDKCFGYLDNIAAFGGDVIMSWAVPGQAGHGHVNCQTNEWVKAQMAERLYVIDNEKTEELRQAVADCRCTWFKNTLLYFKHRK